MQLTGRLNILVNRPMLVNDAWVLDGLLESVMVQLSVCDSNLPMVEATQYLKGRGFNSGDSITVTGSFGTADPIPVFCLTDAQRA